MQAVLIRLAKGEELRQEVGQQVRKEAGKEVGVGMEGEEGRLLRERLEKSIQTEVKEEPTK